MANGSNGPDTLRVPFIFVKHGDPEPRDWMGRHPGWVKFPAVMIPRDSPHHPANGATHPRFDGPGAQPVEAAGQDERMTGIPPGAMSRLSPKERPPQYPGGQGAPPGTPGSGDPIAAFLRANENENTTDDEA